MNSSTPIPPNPQPGWYELSGEPDIERYWDGVQWTEHVRVKKRMLRWSSFSPFINTRLWKWYGLGVCFLVLTVVVFLSLGIQRSGAVQAGSKAGGTQQVCSEIFNFTWYKLNTREFMKSGDASARQANALLLEKYIENGKELVAQDRKLFDLINNLHREVRGVAEAGTWESAAEAGSKADKQFGELADYCSEFVNVKSVPVLSEATENTSIINDEAKQSIPDGYQDNGEGIAYLVSPANICSQDQFGCTRIEIYVYKDCPKGVLVYANLFDIDGKEVARTDGRTEGLVAGQSSVLMLSTGLSTANSALPNKLICE